MAEAAAATDGQTTTAAVQQAPAEGAPATPEPKPAPGTTPETKPTEPEGDAKPASAVPEKYELTYDKAFTDADKAELETMARELGLTNEAAQKLAEKALAGRSSATAAAQKALEAQADKWAADSLADKELGNGDKATLKANLAIAVKARDAFGSKDLIDLLNTTGYGNHPAVIRHFLSLGKAVSEDSFVPAGSGAKSMNTDPASVLYPAQGK